MMLRMCHTSMVPLNHLARTTPPEALLNVVKCMDDTVTKLVAEMVSENPKETVESFRSSHPYVRNQMGWALHDGGMGLRAAANHIFAAFIASKSATFAHTEEAMRELKMGVHTLGHSFKRIEDKILKFALQSFNKLADLWNKNNRQVSDKAKKAPAAAGMGKGKAIKGKRQVTFTPAPDSAEKAAIEPLTIASLAQPDHRYTQRDLSAILDSKDRGAVFAVANQDDLLRLQNISHESWMFLQAKPTDDTTTFDNHTFACGLQHYLGVDQAYACA